MSAHAELRNDVWIVERISPISVVDAVEVTGACQSIVREIRATWISIADAVQVTGAADEKGTARDGDGR
jgi:hypothetical protein